MNKQKIYKGQIRASQVPCCTIELSHMERLFDFINDFNEGAVKHQTATQVQNTNESDEDFPGRWDKNKENGLETQSKSAIHLGQVKKYSESELLGRLLIVTKTQFRFRKP